MQKMGKWILIFARPRCSELGGLRKLSGLFWLICFLHFLVSNVEHLFDAISVCACMPKEICYNL
jgi:hypothetical protein